MNISKSYLITGSSSNELEKHCIDLLFSIYPKEQFESIKTKKNINCIWCYPSGLFYKKQDIEEAVYHLNLEQNNIPFSIIINNAEKLTPMISQSFLKIIEDLSKNKYVFFLAEEIKNIPKTIISRCILINIKDETFKLISEEHKNFADLFLENKINPEEIDILIEKYKIDETSSKRIFFYISQKLIGLKKNTEAEEIVNICRKQFITNMHKTFFKALFILLNKVK
jgi:DNA polymerase III delta prime subunit